MVGKEFLAFPSHLKSRRSPQERREELQYQAPFPESPRCLSPFQGTWFPCTASTFKPRIDSHHSGTWGSPVGKPRRKASRESHRSLDPRQGKRDTAATAREESARACPHSRRGLTPWGDSRSTPNPCQHWRGILRFRHPLHTRSSAPASTGEESREAPEQLAWGLAFPGATRAGP